MVLVAQWDEFYAKAEDLCRSSPMKTRYSVKYKHKEAKLVMKVTDNKVVRSVGIALGCQSAEIL